MVQIDWVRALFGSLKINAGFLEGVFLAVDVLNPDQVAAKWAELRF